MTTELKKNTVYVLGCSHGKYYVGQTTKDVKERFQEHCDGFGAEWTRKYRPIKIIEKFEQADEHKESNKTIDYMKQYGIDNVRGGRYCQVDLPAESRNSIRTQLSSISDSCFKCGRAGHYAAECDNNDNSGRDANERDGYNKH